MPHDVADRFQAGYTLLRTIVVYLLGKGGDMDGEDPRGFRIESYLIVHIVNGLLTLPVHVEDFEERLVHPLIVREPGLHGSEVRALESCQPARNVCEAKGAGQEGLGESNFTHLDLVHVADGLVEFHWLLQK